LIGFDESRDPEVCHRMPPMTPSERERCKDISQKDELVRRFVHRGGLSDPPNAKQWIEYLCAIRAIFGNLNNSISFVATLRAKEYLATQLYLSGFDAAEKARGAPGLDIDIRNPDRRHIVAELKTTVPYGQTDFGAAQKREFQKDFDKLNKLNATHKSCSSPTTAPSNFCKANMPKEYRACWQ
jgi:hypothetical protein